MQTAEESLRLAEIGPRQEDIAGARAQLAAEEAAVSQAERRLADSDLIAPSDGVILTRARERGAIVSPGETVFTLTLSSPVWVRTYVNETRPRPDPARHARRRADRLRAGQVYRGHVGFISPTAEFTPKIGRDARAAHRPGLSPARSSSTTPTAACGRACRSPSRFDVDRAEADPWPTEPAGSRSRASPSDSRRRARRRIDRSDCRIEPGQVTGLVGPDGAGKTTLMRLLAGLLLPDEGRVTVCGFDTRARARRDPPASVSYMPQRFGLYEDLTVLGEPQSLCRSARRGRRRAATGLRAAAGLHRPGAVHRPAGRQALGRHEAEARPGLRPDPHAAAAAARRAQRGRRSRSRAASCGRWSTTWSTRASASSGARPISTRPSAAPTVLLLNEGQLLYDGPPKELTARVAGPQLPRRRTRGTAVGRCWRAALQAPGRRRRRHPGEQRAAGDRARGRRPPDAVGARRRRARGRCRRRRGSRTLSSTCSAAARRANRRSPGHADAAAADGRGGRRGQRADQTVRRLHRRRSDHRSASAAARSSACSAPTAPASRPRSR